MAPSRQDQVSVPCCPHRWPNTDCCVYGGWSTGRTCHWRNGSRCPVPGRRSSSPCSSECDPVFFGSTCRRPSWCRTRVQCNWTYRWLGQPGKYRARRPVPTVVHRIERPKQVVIWEGAGSRSIMGWVSKNSILACSACRLNAICTKYNSLAASGDDPAGLKAHE